MNTKEILVDLDGVLVNFKKKALEVAGIFPEQDPTNKKLRTDFWKAIGAHVKRGLPFFSAMDPMDDAMDLWSYIEKYNPRICSATGHIKGASEEKREWIRKHLGVQVANEAIIVRNGEDKAKHAHANTILIDDRQKVLDPFIEAGGTGILHTSAANTIAQLQAIGM